MLEQKPDKHDDDSSLRIPWFTMFLGVVALAMLFTFREDLEQNHAMNFKPPASINARSSNGSY